MKTILRHLSFGVVRVFTFNTGLSVSSGIASLQIVSDIRSTSPHRCIHDRDDRLYIQSAKSLLNRPDIYCKSQTETLKRYKFTR
jgi:hypothetical protein